MSSGSLDEEIFFKEFIYILFLCIEIFIKIIKLCMRISIKLYSDFLLEGERG